MSWSCNLAEASQRQNWDTHKFQGPNALKRLPLYRSEMLGVPVLFALREIRRSDREVYCHREHRYQRLTINSQ